MALSEQLLRTVLRKSAGPYFKAAALKALIGKSGKEELMLLIDTFKRGPLELQRAIAATVVPDLANPPQIDAVCGLFPQLPADVQAMVLGAFADFGSGTAAVVSTVRQADEKRGLRSPASCDLGSRGCRRFLGR